MEAVERQQRLLRTRVQEVIPMKSKAYRGTAVNRVDAQEVGRGHEGQALTVGLDVGKYWLLAVVRWADGTFERPWRIANPQQLPVLVQLLCALSAGRRLTVALEPSGTYGDPLRQALGDAGLLVHRVSPKMAHDYAEVFDGVPSQHDGKDAAVIAELAALGKSWPWPYVAKDAWAQELTACVEWLDGQRHIYVQWLGRLEALVARHWPEVTRLLKLTSATLLRVLEHYGSPAAVAADPQAVARLQRWSRQWLGSGRAEQVVACARASLGVRLGEIERRSLQEFARQALAARRQMRRQQRQLRALAAGHPVLQALSGVVGVPTACILWARVGDPRQYSSGPAYRKAMGLNLVERSSGTHQGQLRISKRGNPQVRQWLYMVVLRLVQRAGVREWYAAKKRRGPEAAKKALVGVMRKLAVALYRVAAQGATFEAGKLFARRRARRRSRAGGTGGSGKVGPTARG
jgi:transposase